MLKSLKLRHDSLRTPPALVGDVFNGHVGHSDAAVAACNGADGNIILIDGQRVGANSCFEVGQCAALAGVFDKGIIRLQS